MPSYFQRVKYAFRTFFSILDYSRIPDDVLEAFRRTESVPAKAPAAVPAQPIDTPDRALQVLAILQRDGRLVDFLMEDLSPYPDPQVGAAVRDIHAGCRQALERYFTLQPVIDDEEGRPVTVERPDPASVKVVGNVGGGGVVRGVLRHRGWEAARVELPPLPAAGRTILAPAEIEVP